ncbi:uncharacterized protein involved in response to NO [Neorhizobium galegae]|nr:uncharacterized protein involved in response to NO [Neorhizobium galegae]
MLCALLRPGADLFPEFASLIYSLSGTAWLAAFGLFVLEYGPMLIRVRRRVAEG